MVSLNYAIKSVRGTCCRPLTDLMLQTPGRPRWTEPGGGNVLGGKCPRGKCLGGKCPGGNVLGGNVLGGNALGGKCPGGGKDRVGKDQGGKDLESLAQVSYARCLLHQSLKGRLSCSWSLSWLTGRDFPQCYGIRSVVPILQSRSREDHAKPHVTSRGPTGILTNRESWPPF